MKEKDALLTNMKNEIDSIKVYLRSHHENYVRSEYMGQGMPTLMAPSMPSHTMAPMGLMSLPVY